jgi:hypothetical protein
MKAIKQLLLKVIVLLTTIFLAFSGCRKYDTSIVEKDDYEILQKQFFNTESTNDVEIKKLAKDIKRQDSIFKFLPAFIQKNGIPKWDKVLYRTKNKNGNTGKNPGLGDGQVSTFTENSSNTASQGVFFIPLQSTTSSEIKSYITAYKHNDSLYTYRLYNKDSLGEVHATNAQEKSNLLNTQAVFGYFEKSVNNKDSVTIGNDGNKTVIKNANIAINEKNNSSIKNLSTTTLYAGGSCEVTFEISITYFQADYYINGYYVGSVYGMEFYMSITISCSGGGGGDCGCGNPGGGVGNPSGGGYGDPNGGYDPNNPGGGNWWNSGTGWPWNNPYYYAGYDPNNPNPYNPGWGWWWNGGGGSLPYDPDLDPLSYPETQEILMFEGDYRNQMSLEELQIFDNMTRLQQLQYLTNAKYALDEAQSLYPTSIHNGNGDAFRHALFSALNAKVLGVALAKQLGDAHELKPGSPVLENQMDLFNNQIGRDVFAALNAAGQAGQFFKVGLIQTLQNKILNGDLRKLSPLDPSDNVIPGVTQLVPTN